MRIVCTKRIMFSILLPVILVSLHHSLVSATECEEVPRSTFIDKLSWTYDDNHKGNVHGVCSPSKPCGPSMWWKIEGGPGVNQCGLKSQTPIDISDSIVSYAVSTPVKFSVVGGGCMNWTSFVDDHALEVSFSEAGMVCDNHKITIDGVVYTLLQLHFHAPSEHTLKTADTEAELHLVHKSADGKLAVLGVFLVADDKADDNKMLKDIWYSTRKVLTAKQAMDFKKTAKAVVCEKKMSEILMNAYDYIPTKRDFYRYSGSLTTYPCTEGVLWTVYKQPIKVSKYDIMTMRKAPSYYSQTIVSSSGSDNRPVQPLNGRKVGYYTDPKSKTSGSVKSYIKQDDKFRKGNK